MIIAGAPPINPNTRAIAAIRHTKDFSFPVTPVNAAAKLILARLALANIDIGPWPGKDDNRDIVGNWCINAVQTLFDAANDADKEHEMFNAAIAQSPAAIGNLLAGNAQLVALLVSTVRKFLESASRYADSREISCRLQMNAEGYSPAQIDAVCSDPLSIRTYIQQRRQLLLEQLEATHAKMTANDPMDLATEKEIAFFNKHRGWYLDGHGEEDEYLPNDNAVPYMLLSYEIFYNIRRTGAGNAVQLVGAFDAFCAIAHNALDSQSATRSWTTMSRTPNHIVNGFDVGTALRDYVSFLPRSGLAIRAVADKKLQTATQRGPRRLQRILATLHGGPSQFSILNLTTDLAVPQLIELKSREVAAEVAIAAATTIGAGVMGLSDAESMVWLMFLGRSTLLETAIGRNDLSLPALVGGLIGIDTSAFGNLDARAWAISEDLEA